MFCFFKTGCGWERERKDRKSEKKTDLEKRMTDKKRDRQNVGKDGDKDVKRPRRK